VNARLGLGILMVVGMLLAGCAPAGYRVVERDALAGPPRDLSVLSEVERTAWRVWLAMEMGRVDVGRYDTSALLDVTLPQGARWTLVTLDTNTYVLRVEGTGSETYDVRPEGVRDTRSNVP